MSIIIGADFVPTKSNMTFFEKGNMNALIDAKLLDVLNNGNYRIFNLEVPLTDNSSPISKCGPALIAQTKSIKGYQQLGVDLLTLANNHILDQGEDGLISTLKTLDQAGIDYVGAASILEKASKPYFFSYSEKKIGVYACAEHEFSIATSKTAGANPFDPLETLDHIVKAKENCDFLIVLYHGGKEHYRYPSPELQKVCRKIIEKGADLVVCQHSHCIGCKEEYDGGTIVYGQGNFLFDNANNEFWNTALLISIDEFFQTSFIPICKSGNGVRLATDEEREEILDGFLTRSEQIRDFNFVEKKYNEFSLEMLSNYLLPFFGISNNFLFRVINRLSKYHFQDYYISKIMSDKTNYQLQNYLACEAHRELFLNGLKKKSMNVNNVLSNST